MTHTKPLDETTWPDFAELVERHNGVFGGCWCMSFHAEGKNARNDGPPQEIARLGGGTVESHPEDAADRSVSSSFLYNGTVAMFERPGFERTRQLGKNHWVVTRTVAAAE